MDKYERVTNVYARLDGKYEGRRQFGRHGHRWELLLQRVIQYKPTKCTFHKLIFYFLIFLCILHVSNLRIHLQEDGCMYCYSTVRFTCISISSLVRSRVFSILSYRPQY